MDNRLISCEQVMIKGIGVDIVNIARISKLYENFSCNFVNKILSEKEVEIFNINIGDSHKIPYLSKRFAAKEAVSKAFGCGIGVLGLKNISVINDDNGKPFVGFGNINFIASSDHKHLYDMKDAATWDDRYQCIIMQNLHISISDEREFAMAFVVIS